MWAESSHREVCYALCEDKQRCSRTAHRQAW